MAGTDVKQGSPLLLLDLDPEKLGLERIEHLRQKMQNRVASLCSERAMIYTRVFRELADEPFMKRKALAFATTLREMTVYVEADSLIFGNQASRNFAAPIFPEYSIDWVINELDEFALRTGDSFQVSEDVKEDLEAYSWGVGEYDSEDGCDGFREGV